MAAVPRVYGREKCLVTENQRTETAPSSSQSLMRVTETIYLQTESQKSHGRHRSSAGVQVTQSRQAENPPPPMERKSEHLERRSPVVVQVAEQVL